MYVHPKDILDFGPILVDLDVQNVLPPHMSIHPMDSLDFEPIAIL